MINDLLRNAVLYLISGIIVVGLMTYTALYFFPLYTHRSLMIKKLNIIISDIVSESIECNRNNELAWLGIVQSIHRLSDISADIPLDQLIGELENDILYPKSGVVDRSVLQLHVKIRHRLKKALTKDPNLATLTIPKKTIVLWIKVAIKNTGA